MKEVKHYICEFCGTQFNTKEKAEECEMGHHKPKKIKECKYISCSNDTTGAPIHIYVEMDDGKLYVYRKVSRA